MTKQQDMDWRRFVLEQATAPATTLPAAPMATGVAPQPFTLAMGPPGFDVLETLPVAAADKLRALRQRSADSHALTVSFEDVRQASMAKVEAETAHRRLVDHASDGGFGLKEDDRRVIEVQKRVDKATADFERLQQLQQTRTLQWQSASAATANVETYLLHGRPGNCIFEVVETEATLNKGETVVDAIERHRRRVRELRADLHRIESAPYPSGYAKQRAREQIEQLSMRGQISVSRLIEHDGPLDFPSLRVQSEVHGAQRSLAFHEAIDTAGLFAWMFKDAMINRLDAEIDAESDDAAALSHADRERRTAEAMGDLLAIEREEAALVYDAWSKNLPIEHRSDISPLALLGVALVVAPRASDDASSPEHEGFNLLGRRR